MQTVGYKLIRIKDGAEVQSWGGVYGVCPGVPNPIFLPNGDHVHAPSVGVPYSGHQLVAWEMEAPAPTANDVRAECRRRMRVLLSARDDAHLDTIISNGMREAVRLLRKGSENWTEEEAARSAQLDGADAMIEAIRAASNVMEENPPQDYASDKRWP